jgi:hypothetical protein
VDFEIVNPAAGSIFDAVDAAASDLPEADEPFGGLMDAAAAPAVEAAAQGYGGAYLDGAAEPAAAEEGGADLPNIVAPRGHDEGAGGLVGAGAGAGAGERGAADRDGAGGMGM